MNKDMDNLNKAETLRDNQSTTTAQAKPVDNGNAKTNQSTATAQREPVDNGGSETTGRQRQLRDNTTSCCRTVQREPMDNDRQLKDNQSTTTAQSQQSTSALSGQQSRTTQRHISRLEITVNDSSSETKKSTTTAQKQTIS